MPRVPRRDRPSTTAREIFETVDMTILSRAITSILNQGGAVMLGQTRDNEKLIVTVYLDGEQDKEYCSDASSVQDFIGQYQV